MPATQHDHQHAEAFAIMLYAPDDGTEGEFIWNSRDGVTPFIITLRNGKEATHANWKMDRYDPDFVPPEGSRVFVDLSPEMARASYATRIEEWWDHQDYPMSKRWATKEEALDALAKERQLGSPALVDAEEYGRMLHEGTLFLESPVAPRRFRGSPAGTDRFA